MVPSYQEGGETIRRWKLGFKERGLAIEAQLGGNLPANFPTIDKFADGVATSIKSLDTNAPTYQKVSALRSKLRGYVNSVAGLSDASHGGVTITAAQVTDRQLDLALPRGGVNDDQLKVIQDAIGYGLSKDVTVNVWSI